MAQCFRLSKADYTDMVKEHKSMQQMCRYRFLKSVFPSVPDWRCYELSHIATEVYFKRTEVVY